MQTVEHSDGARNSRVRGTKRPNILATKNFGGHRGDTLYWFKVESLGRRRFLVTEVYRLKRVSDSGQKQNRQF